MTSRYLTAEQAADYLNLPSVAALHSFLYRRRQAGFPVVTHRLGKSLRFTAGDLDAALTCERPRSFGRKAS